jgi:hypothetical protein
MRYLPILRFFGYAILLASSLTASAQTAELRDDAGKLSPPVRTAEYAESIYPHGILPDWDRGYVLSHGIEVHSSADETSVLMYDQYGKRVREGHIWPPGAGRVRLRRAAATHEGAILAAGWAIMPDGSSPKFIAKTDLQGNTIKTTFTDSFAPEQICEAEDETVWTLGRDVPAQDSGGRTDVLRQYSFEKGLLRSYLPLESVRAPLGSNISWFNAFGSFVRCGTNKIVAYLKFTDEYVEIDTKSFEVKRWKLDLSPADQGEATGLGITDNGHVYASFARRGCLEGETVQNGLFEIRANSAESTASLRPVKGTLSLRGCGSPERPPKPRGPGTFRRLWGTDGNALAIAVVGQQVYEIVLVNVIGQEVASN